MVNGKNSLDKDYLDNEFTIEEVIKVVKENNIKIDERELKYKFYRKIV